MHRRVLAFFLFVALPLAAQGLTKSDNDDADDDQDDNTSVTVDVRPSSLGNVNIAVYGGPAAALAVVPGALNCAWMETSRNEYEVSGTCRGWLKPSKNFGTLRLA